MPPSHQLFVVRLRPGKAKKPSSTDLSHRRVSVPEGAGPGSRLDLSSTRRRRADVPVFRGHRHDRAVVPAGVASVPEGGPSSTCARGTPPAFSGGVTDFDVPLPEPRLPSRAMAAALWCHPAPAVFLEVAFKRQPGPGTRQS